jgi:hypothetical protein
MSNLFRSRRAIILIPLLVLLVVLTVGQSNQAKQADQGLRVEVHHSDIPLDASKALEPTKAVLPQDKRVAQLEVTVSKSLSREDYSEAFIRDGFSANSAAAAVAALANVAEEVYAQEHLGTIGSTCRQAQKTIEATFARPLVQSEPIACLKSA